jgi:hypothetical protein
MEIAMRELAMLLLGSLLGWFGRVRADKIQRRGLFDHRLRLEKEHETYADLWERLFEFRRTAHRIVDPLQEGIQGNPQQEFVEAFNAFQGVVRRNEPFIVPQVYEPARAIVAQGWAIVAASKQIRMLDEHRSVVRDCGSHEPIANKMMEEDKEQQEALEEIDPLFPQVKDAIRQRIMLTPPSGRSRRHCWDWA